MPGYCCGGWGGHLWERPEGHTGQGFCPTHLLSHMNFKWSVWPLSESAHFKVAIVDVMGWTFTLPKRYPHAPAEPHILLLIYLSLTGMQQISEQGKYQKNKTFSKFQILEYLEADAMTSGISFKILQGKKGEWEQMRTDEIRMVKCQNMLKLCDGYMRAHQIILYFVCMFPNVHNKGNK